MKRRLLSIKAPRLSISELRFWWPALVIIILLCVMLILKLPNIEECAIVALVLVTFMYVVFTKRILDETRRQRVNASQAVIWPDVYWASDYFLRALYNIGNAPALKVTVRIQNEPITLHSHISPGDKKENGWRPDGWPDRPRTATGFGDYDEESLKRIADLRGPYLLVVTWEDLMEQHFEARLLFSLGVNSLGLVSLSILEGPTLKTS